MAETVSELEAMLAAINAHILARISGGAVDRYLIEGRDISLINLEQLRQLRTELRYQLNSMNSASSGGVALAEFSRPS